MIRLDDLHVLYGSFAAVDGLDLDIRRGELFGLLGPNGAGKSTTIRVLIGQRRPDAGRVTVAGLDVVRDWAKIKPLFGYVPDRENHFEEFTGRRNLEFFGQLYGVPPAAGGTCSSWSSWSEAADLPVRGYSLGMRKKLLLARALLHEPPVLYLDEPTANLDIHSAEVVHRILRERVRHGATVVLTTHDMDEVEKICDRVGIVCRGKLVALDSPLALKQEHTERKVDVIRADGERLVFDMDDARSRGNLAELVGGRRRRQHADPRVRLPRDVPEADRARRSSSVEPGRGRPRTADQLTRGILRALRPEGGRTGTSPTAAGSRWRLPARRPRRCCCPCSRREEAAGGTGMVGGVHHCFVEFDRAHRRSSATCRPTAKELEGRSVPQAPATRRPSTASIAYPAGTGAIQVRGRPRAGAPAATVRASTSGTPRATRPPWPLTRRGSGRSRGGRFAAGPAQKLPASAAGLADPDFDPDNDWLVLRGAPPVPGAGRGLRGRRPGADRVVPDLEIEPQGAGRQGARLPRRHRHRHGGVRAVLRLRVPAADAQLRGAGARRAARPGPVPGVAGRDRWRPSSCSTRRSGSAWPPSWPGSTSRRCWRACSSGCRCWRSAAGSSASA